MDLKCTMLSEKRKKKPISKDYILYNFIYITFLNDKTIEMEAKLVVARRQRYGWEVV